MDEYPFNDYRNYLAHHGVKGQKHGVRNAEWYPIADYEAHLARTGQTHGGSSSDSSKALSKSIKKATGGFLGKSNKDAIDALLKDKNILELSKSTQNARKKYKKAYEKYMELNDKGEKTKQDYKNYKKALKDYQDFLDKTAREALGPHADDEVYTFTDTYEDAKTWIKRTKAQLLSNALWVANVDTSIKENGKAVTMPNDLVKQSEQSSEKIKNELDRARKTDRFQLDFLETIQNDPISRSGAPQSELLKEYEKYLKDPDDYMRNFERSEWTEKGINTPKYKKLMKKSREIGWNNLTEEERQYLEKYDE